MPDQMPSREQMIADLQAAQAQNAMPSGMPSREQMIADIQGAQAPAEKPSGVEKFAGDMGQTLGNDLEALKVGAHGAANAITANYLPNIEGGVQAPFMTARDLISGDADLNEIGDALKKNYISARDSARQYENQLEAEAPVAYTLGGITSAPLTPIGDLGIAAKGGGLASRIAAAGARGAAYAGLANPGDVQGQITPLQIDQRLKNAEFGGALGLGSQGLVEAAEQAPETIDSIRRWMTAKQLGANTGQLKKIIKELPSGGMKIDQLEKYMDDNGMLNLGTTYSGVVDKSGDLIDQSGKNIEGIYSGLDQKLASNPDLGQQIGHTNLNGKDLAQEFYDQEAQKLAKKNGGAAALNSLKNELGLSEDMPEMGPPGTLSGMGPNMSLSDAHQFRASVDDQIPWGSDTNGKLLAQSRGRLRTFLNQKIQDRVAAADQALNESNLPELLQANKSYSNAKTVNDIAQNTKAREMAKYVPGLVGTLGGGAYGVYDAQHGDNIPAAIAKGAAVGLGLRAARAIAPAITYRMATGLQPAATGLAKYLEEHPEAAQKSTVIPWLMMQQNGGNQ